MFQPTKNVYQFRYIETGITGEGVKEVYLPETEPEEILYKDTNKWHRPEMPAQLKQWAKEWFIEKQRNPDFVHARAAEIVAWEEQEWKRSTEGAYFMNNGVLTYITAFYYWYLTAWRMYFGFANYRETDKELTYLIQFIEEDPNCFGLLLNTIRRYGKSSLIAAWIVFRTIRHFNHTAGMQGETEKKVRKFYNKMVLKPFQKLPYYYRPKVDNTSTNKNEIRFDITPVRGKNKDLQVFGDDEALESMIDYRATVATEYDGENLDSYLIEEPGKILEESIYSDEGDGIWDVVKPAFLKGKEIRGKAMLATTVEFLNVADRGGAAYKELFFDSDFDDKKRNNRTKSGLYACFIPGDCAHQDYLDEWGHPKREEAREFLLTERESFNGNPSKKAGLIRKYPLTIAEIFYVNPDTCEFNAEVLQDRLLEIRTSKHSMWERVDLQWENNIRFGRVIWRKNQLNGWLKINYLPNFDQSNQIESLNRGGLMSYRPLDDDHFAIGFDPIQTRISAKKSQVRRRGGDQDGESSSRLSRPVALVKRKYDSKVDGVMDDDLMKQRATARFPYQTNKYVALMDKRPTDPNVLFERLLMMCWFFGASVHVEKQKDAVINWFHEKNCGDFILAKYSHFYDGGRPSMSDGTAATPRLIEEYTMAYAHYIDNFGHTIPFEEQIEDALLFNPNDTTVHDYTVAAGFTELACKMKPKVQDVQRTDIADFMPVFDRAGNLVG